MNDPCVTVVLSVQPAEPNIKLQVGEERGVRPFETSSGPASMACFSMNSALPPFDTPLLAGPRDAAQDLKG